MKQSKAQDLMSTNVLFVFLDANYGLIDAFNPSRHRLSPHVFLWSSRAGERPVLRIILDPAGSNVEEEFLGGAATG